jgi:TPP-dependent pyruvate/acetoin dehydrogenase alpha subunit
MDKSAQRTQEEIDALYLMLLIRRFEERAAQQYQMGGKIGGF